MYIKLPALTMVILGHGLSLAQAPPNSGPPDYSEAIKQKDIDTTAYNNLSGQYGSIVSRKYAADNDLFSLNKQLESARSSLPGEQLDKANRALRRATQAIFKATPSLVKANFDINTMGFQFLSIEKSACYYADYEVSLAIGRLAKPYWDDAGVMLSGACALIGDAQTQLNTVKGILNPEP
jgi:hypothetical protein